jgi:hypothetical protein
MVITTSDAFTASVVRILGFLGGDVDAFFSHGLNGYRVDLVGWLAAGGANLNGDAG